MADDIEPIALGEPEPTLRLGRLAPDPTRPRIFMSHFLDYATLPPLPSSRSWTDRISNFPMMLNNRWGDCVVAGKGHMAQIFSSYGAGNEVIASDALVEKTYFTESGGRDSGLNEDISLRYWTNHPLAGVELLGYASVNAHDIKTQSYSVALFGGCFYGVLLPDDCMDAINNGTDWDVTRLPQNPQAGHCIVAVGYNAKGPLFATWGRIIQASWAWAMKYADEAYCLLGKDWVSKFNAPSGVQTKAMLDAFLALTGKAPPDVSIPPPTEFNWDQVI